MKLTGQATSLFGVGLRSPHYNYLRTQPTTAVQFFEAISENYMDSNGPPLEILEFIRNDYPVCLHGVSLSIGGATGLNFTYLKSLKKLVDRIEPLLVSDHLCWTGNPHGNIHDLLPMPYTFESLEFLLRQIDQVQQYLGRQILLENVSSYLRLADDDFTEWQFLNEMSARSGCRLLLDINNIRVSSFNHGFSAEEFVDSIPQQIVGQIHLAGYTDMGKYLFDTHSQPVFPEVWQLYSRVIKRMPEVPVLVEWDEDIPEFSVVQKEAVKARQIWESHHGTRRVSTDVTKDCRSRAELRT